MYLDVVSDYADVLKVQRSVNLIHNVEWRWLVVMECKYLGYSMGL